MSHRHRRMAEMVFAQRVPRSEKPRTNAVLSKSEAFAKEFRDGDWLVEVRVPVAQCQPVGRLPTGWHHAEARIAADFVIRSLGIRHSFVIRYSCFVIRDQSAGRAMPSFFSFHCRWERLIPS